MIIIAALLHRKIAVKGMNDLPFHQAHSHLRLRCRHRRQRPLQVLQMTKLGRGHLLRSSKRPVAWRSHGQRRTPWGPQCHLVRSLERQVAWRTHGRHHRRHERCMSWGPQCHLLRRAHGLHRREQSPGGRNPASDGWIPRQSSQTCCGLLLRFLLVVIFREDHWICCLGE